MHISLSEPLDILTWAYRLLYVLLFVSLMVVMGQWNNPITIPFLGAVLAFLFPLLFSRKELLNVEEDAREKTEKILLNEQ